MTGNISWEDGHDRLRGGTDMVVSLMMEIEESPTVNEWIPVSERLPKEHGAYLVTFSAMPKDKMIVTILLYGKPLMPSRKIKEACWYDSYSEYGDIVCDDVVAWMPLPEPYKGGENHE